MYQSILDSIQTLQAKSEAPHSHWITPYEGDRSPDDHQFAFFLKPELTARSADVNLDAVLELVLNTLNEWNIRTGAVGLLNGTYLKANRIMDKHYGVLNEISHQGRSAISQGAEKNLQSKFADQLKAGATVLGAHQFMAAVPEFSPLALTTLSDNLGAEKLGGGTYALSMKVRTDHYIVLNAFHPYQLEPFYAADNILILFEGRSDKAWADLRQNLAGATNPADASPGSIRNQFLQNKEKLGLKDVSSGTNGIHLSAGPLEGMVEIQRFFSDPTQNQLVDFSDTCFGKKLSAGGANDQRINELAENPTIEKNGTSESAFDLTEECDVAAAAKALL